MFDAQPAGIDAEQFGVVGQRRMQISNSNAWAIGEKELAGLDGSVLGLDGQRRGEAECDLLLCGRRLKGGCCGRDGALQRERAAKFVAGFEGGDKFREGCGLVGGPRSDGEG